MSEGEVDASTLPPRELAKELLRIDSSRGEIVDPAVPLAEVVKALRRGSGGMCGGWPGGYDVCVRGLHVEVARSQGVEHDPPIRFTTHEIVREMRAEALAPASPAKQLDLWSLASLVTAPLTQADPEPAALPPPLATPAPVTQVDPAPRSSLTIAIGDRVSITPHSRPAYPPPYRDWEGIAVSVAVSRSRTGVRRWLVDYLPTGGWGRYQVREEHLERVTAVEGSAA